MMIRESAKRIGRAQPAALESADPVRVEAMAAAKRFKRSWIEMAGLVTQIKLGRLYEPWGFADLYEYCSAELRLKRATVEKLTGSYRTLERHAPELLDVDASNDRIPSFESVDYFARAIGERQGRPSATSSPEVLDKLKGAVFEEARPLAAIRRQFHEALYPKGDDERSAELVERTRAQVRRLLDALASVDGLRTTTRDEARRSLERLESELVTIAARTERDDANGAGSAMA